MSECIGEGCTQLGCSGRNADAVNSLSPAAQMQAALAATQAQAMGRARQDAHVHHQASTAAAEGNEPMPWPGNRADRRRAARKGRRSG